MQPLECELFVSGGDPCNESASLFLIVLKPKSIVFPEVDNDIFTIGQGANNVPDLREYLRKHSHLWNRLPSMPEFYAGQKEHWQMGWSCKMRHTQRPFSCSLRMDEQHRKLQEKSEAT
jgi:hypothetical protein